MHRTGLTILFLLLSICLMANDTISIPLQMSVFYYMPMDKPTGSTPDPTDPNQFRASLTGNTLLIQTQTDAVSYVAVQETESDRQGEDYFFAVSYGAVSCPITRAGQYTIRIGYWKTDFVGHLWVKKITVVDLNGHLWVTTPEKINELPEGLYILRMETSLGNTMFKLYKKP